jgi:transposase-like protein
MSLKKKTGRQRREFTKEFKLNVLAELDGGLGMAQVARKYQVHPSTIRNWRNKLVNIKTALLQAVVKLIPMKLGSPSSNAWSGA